MKKDGEVKEQIKIKDSTMVANRYDNHKIFITRTIFLTKHNFGKKIITYFSEKEYSVENEIAGTEITYFNNNQIKEYLNKKTDEEKVFDENGYLTYHSYKDKKGNKIRGIYKLNQLVTKTITDDSSKIINHYKNGKLFSKEIRKEAPQGEKVLKYDGNGKLIDEYTAAYPEIPSPEVIEVKEYETVEYPKTEIKSKE